MRSFTKTFFASAILLFLTGQMEAQKVTHFKVTHHPRQTIDGFGASDAWSMWQMGTWADSVQQKVADWLFSSDTFADGSPKGIGLSIWRFNAGTGSAAQGDAAQINRDTRTERFEKQTGQRRFLQLAKERGVPTFLAFYNSPPVHLTQNGLATNTGRDGTFNLRPDAYDDFAAYMADMLQAAEREDGIHFDYICPVNEPDGHWNWLGPKQEGTPATNREVARIVREMSREFLQRGITTKVLVNESSDFRCMWGIHQTDWQRGYEIQCFWNPDSTDTYVGNLSNVARVMAGHSYWTNTPILKPHHRGYGHTGLYGYRKRLKEEFDKVDDVGFWMTELCIMSNDEEIHGGGGFDFTMEEALYVARVMHYDLTVANARSWQWWRAAGGNYKDGLIRMYQRQQDVRDSKLMWTLGNFSRFVRPGAVRLDMEGTMEADGLMLSAYRNADGTLAIVGINYSKEDQAISLDLSAVNHKLSTVNYQLSTNAVAYRTSDVEGENLKCVGAVSLERTTLPARSVTTFVCASKEQDFGNTPNVPKTATKAWEGSPEDSALVVKLLREAPAERGTENRVFYFGKKFLGLPYVAHTLELGDTEHLIVNLHELDCTTFVETVVALSMCDQQNRRTFEDFCRNLTKLRFRNGQMTDYTSRLHYFTWWAEDNERLGIVEDISALAGSSSSNNTPSPTADSQPSTPFTATQTVHINYMSTHPSLYKQLKNHPDFVPTIRTYEQATEGRQFSYIPKKNLAWRQETSLGMVRDGDIVAMLTDSDGLDTRHIGIAFWQDGQLHLLHASSLYKKVLLSKETFYEYEMKQPKHTGIRVFRLK